MRRRLARRPLVRRPPAKPRRVLQRPTTRPRPARQRQLSRVANRSTLKRLGLRQNRRPARLRNPRSIRRNIQRSTQRNMSTISHDQNAKRFTTEVDGHRAELDYTVADSVMTITHTRVPREIGGRGIAAELMRAALQVAAERGLSINPACSYAAAYMRKQAQQPTKSTWMNCWMRRWRSLSRPATHPRWAAPTSARTAMREAWGALRAPRADRACHSHALLPPPICPPAWCACPDPCRRNIGSVRGSDPPRFAPRSDFP